MENLFRKTPIQLELPLIIKGNSYGLEKKGYQYHGFKNQADFFEAVRFDREWKLICKQRGIEDGN